MRQYLAIQNRTYNRHLLWKTSQSIVTGVRLNLDVVVLKGKQFCLSQIGGVHGTIMHAIEAKGQRTELHQLFSSRNTKKYVLVQLETLFSLSRLLSQPRTERIGKSSV